MSSRQRNMIVGLVVIVGLGIVVWMILLFAGRVASFFAAPGVPITLVADQAEGVSEGSEIKYLGVPVGRVLSFRRGDDNKSVVIGAEVNKQPSLPANVQGVITMSSAFGGVATIKLELTSPTPSGVLAGGTELHAAYEGSSLLPKSVTDLAESIRRQDLIKHVDETVVSLRVQSERAGQMIQSVQQLVGDPKLRDDLRTSLANIRTAAESANRVANNMEKFTGDLHHITVQTDDVMGGVRVAVARLSTTLERFESVANKVDQGKGTAGMLVNDPKLYQGLVDTTRELNLTIKDLQRVVEQWEQEGVTLKLGK